MSPLSAIRHSLPVRVSSMKRSLLESEIWPKTYLPFGAHRTPSLPCPFCCEVMIPKGCEKAMAPPESMSKNRAEAAMRLLHDASIFLTSTHTDPAKCCGVSILISSAGTPERFKGIAIASAFQDMFASCLIARAGTWLVESTAARGAGQLRPPRKAPLFQKGL